jgi:hypothetical protein
LPVIALSTRDLSPEERERLDGRVQQIINTEDDAAGALLSALRALPAGGRTARRTTSAALREEVHGQDTAR